MRHMVMGKFFQTLSNTCCADGQGVLHTQMLSDQRMVKGEGEISGNDMKLTSAKHRQTQHYTNTATHRHEHNKDQQGGRRRTATGTTRRRITRVAARTTITRKQQFVTYNV